MRRFHAADIDADVLITLTIIAISSLLFVGLPGVVVCVSIAKLGIESHLIRALLMGGAGLLFSFLTLSIPATFGMSAEGLWLYVVSFFGAMLFLVGLLVC